MAGRFIPSCDEDGFYRKQQCDRGECWCVNQNGGEVAGSRIRGKPDCGECQKVSDADKKQIFWIESWMQWEISADQRNSARVPAACILHKAFFMLRDRAPVQHNSQ